MIGILGGTGLYQLPALQVTDRQTPSTPFGKISAPIILGTWQGCPMAFLARHGESHELLPSEVNYRANLWALKSLGVRRVIAVSAVGSLTDPIAPGDLALPNQYVDFTGGRRAGTFFGEGLVAHVSTATPTCGQLEGALAAAAQHIKARVHRNVTYACVAGPRLGTRAESQFLRHAGGAQLVGMTNVPEAFLAREAQLCYCTVAVVTDYDCWQTDPALHVAADQVLQLYRENLGTVLNLLAEVLPHLNAEGAGCSCRTALHSAVVSAAASLTPEKRALLDLLSL
ncbi:MAG: S-methyl-5'-thioadenosine phosphorylase [Sinobacteraceae bacterium]|nr:S-methyl-5'-thioadenosine phosphorylase [Nevskiaceae bacterium]